MANFIRKNNNPAGRYHASYKIGMNEVGQTVETETIDIEGREIYSTDDKKKIDFLRNDPEIIEIDKKTKIEMAEAD